MLSLDDCIAFSGLTSEQVDAVACFKHVPPIIAAEWAEEALESVEGVVQVEHMLEAEATLAADHHLADADDWKHGLDDFRQAHPELAR